VINKLRNHLLHKRAFTEVICISYTSISHYSRVTKYVWSPKSIKCPYLEAVWGRVNSCWIPMQQICHLLRRANPPSLRRGGPLSKHTDGLGTNRHLVMGPDGARSQERLCWRGSAVICCYVMLCYGLSWVKSVSSRCSYPPFCIASASGLKRRKCTPAEKVNIVSYLWNNYN
jgi:hypothetical protein